MDLQVLRSALGKPSHVGNSALIKFGGSRSVALRFHGVLAPVDLPMSLDAARTLAKAHGSQVCEFSGLKAQPTGPWRLTDEKSWYSSEPDDEGYSTPTLEVSMTYSCSSCGTSLTRYESGEDYHPGPETQVMDRLGFLVSPAAVHFVESTESGIITVLLSSTLRDASEKYARKHLPDRRIIYSDNKPDSPAHYVILAK